MPECDFLPSFAPSSSALSGSSPATGLLFPDLFAFKRFGALVAEGLGFQQFTQAAPGIEAVEGLCAGLLHLDLEACRSVPKVDTGCRPVDFLAAGTACSDKMLFEIGFAQVAGGHSLA